jgi:KUP system potassium uptake protein
MPAVTSVPEHTALSRATQPATPAAALTALGIVYGDLGTSPLYTLQAIVGTLGGKFGAEVALGSLSLIFWTLIVTISVKYCLLVMRADNHGEGGILALMSLTGAQWAGRDRALIVMGLLGAALIYGDGIITPAISVLSAVEGLNVATDAVRAHVMPLAVAILLGLFAVQGRGTAHIGKAFGPVMLIWFLAIAALGVFGIVQHPAVLAAVDPRHGMLFLTEHGWIGFAALGGVFLAITGGEALYADMGHIGRNSIRTVWYGLVLPALLLNYAGQSALFLENPNLEGNPFFKLAPAWTIYPLVALATLATIIASQAIITGSFSMTRQAMQLGWFPGVRIRQTSSEEYGQIYVPFVNWTMMVATLALTIVFASSDRLAGAYGTAVSTTMLLTTGLLYAVMRRRWRWPLAATLAIISIFLVVDFGFFCANLFKVREGGWIPLVFGTLVFIVMTTWRFGIEALHQTHLRVAKTPEQFFRGLAESKIARVPGTAVFLTRTFGTMPPIILQHAEQMGALPRTFIALAVKFEDIPRVHGRDRLELIHVLEGLWHVTVHYGFVEIPNLPAALRQAKELGCPVDLSNAVYFGERDALVPAKARSRVSRWRLAIFAFMLRNSVRAVDLFDIPPRHFVEVSRQIEI